MSGSFWKMWRNLWLVATSTMWVPGSVIAMKCLPASSAPTASVTRR